MTFYRIITIPADFIFVKALIVPENLAGKQMLFDSISSDEEERKTLLSVTSACLSLITHVCLDCEPAPKKYPKAQDSKTD